jgi:hypothetical protein
VVAAVTEECDAAFHSYPHPDTSANLPARKVIHVVGPDFRRKSGIAWEEAVSVRTMDSALLVLATLGCGCWYGARFSTEIYTQGCHCVSLLGSA